MHLGLHLPPNLALFLCIGLIFSLFWLDSRRGLSVSRGIWVPTIWMALVASRPLELWFTQGSLSTGAFEQGSPIEALIYSFLIVAGLVILSRRKEKFSLSGLMSDNGPLFLLLAYYAFAIIWADYPFVSFKRYIKLIGVMVMILVILTDADPALALRTALRRCGYILLPLSLVLAKYFPAGVSYDPWTGEATVIGVCDTKNMLGQLCLVLGLYYLWDFILQWKNKFPGRDRLMLAIDGFFFLIAIDLLLAAHSATSFACLIFGSAILLAAGYESVQKRIGTYFVIGSLAFLVLSLSSDLVPAIIHALGRNTTLTDRTFIWQKLLPMAKENPWLGSGYQSFWTPRVLEIMHVNEAHNGYLEIVLNTGLVGLFLFSIFAVSAYRHCRETISSMPEYGRFILAVFFTALLYNFTEAAFRGLDILYFLFLAISLRLPETVYVRSMHAFTARYLSSPHQPEIFGHRNAAIIKRFPSSNAAKQPDN